MTMQPGTVATDIIQRRKDAHAVRDLLDTACGTPDSEHNREAFIEAQRAYAKKYNSDWRDETKRFKMGMEWGR